MIFGAGIHPCVGHHRRAGRTRTRTVGALVLLPEKSQLRTANVTVKGPKPTQRGSDQRGFTASTQLAPCHSACGCKRWRALCALSSPSTPLLEDSGDDNSGVTSGNGGSGSGGGSGEEGTDPHVAALLLAAGRTTRSFPADMSSAITSGKVSSQVLQRYLELEAKALLAWLMQFQGFRERLLADPGFLTKVAIELGIGICTKMTAEYTKRQSAFNQELDFVAANVMMALIADFMLVWLPAPTLSYTSKAATGSGPGSLLSQAFAGCPDNAFQLVQPGMPPFTLAQRLGAPLRNGLKLFAVGVSASFVGVAVTNALILLRQALDPGFVPLNQPQDVLAMSAAYGVYMATSSNIRYQVLAGVIEERGIEKVFKGNYQLCGLLSLLVRTANTFLGSLLWVDFIRLLGMQKGGGAH